MATSCMFLAILVAFTTFSFALSAISPNKTPACRDSGLFRCIGPVMAYAMSADGQRLSKMRKTGSLTEKDYGNACRTAQTAVSCVNSWIGQCMPTEQPDLHILSKGTAQLLTVCNETDSFAKFSKMAQCAERMNETHKTCGETMRAKIQQKNVNLQDPKAVFQLQNLQRKVCCVIKKYHDCVAPTLETTCDAEGKTLTQKFLNRVFGSYQCTDTTFAACVEESASAA